MQKFFSNPTGLHTDLYQLTMAKGYWESGLYKRKASFHLFYRNPPFGGSHLIAAGLEAGIEFIQNFRFSVSDIQYLASLKGSKGTPLFDESFLNHLQRMKFSCTMEAVPEGTVVFPFTPLLRIEGPIIQTQLLETGLLNILNFSSLIATKASRIVQAAKGDPVLEFGYRRAQGPDGALSASRAAFVGGCVGTSNVRAGKLFGIPVMGTHAHSWILCFDNEKTAFRQYAASQPHDSIFLVDTFDTLSGVRNAIEVGREMRASGYEMKGIRLDSGNLTELSKEARKMLDAAGFEKASIVASNDLNEYRIKKHKEAGAQINVWGVGTQLATAYEQAALGGVYKLGAIENEEGRWEPRIKLSEQKIKISNPGRISTLRYEDTSGQVVGDMIYDLDSESHQNEMLVNNPTKVINFEGNKAKQLLIPIFEEGKLVYSPPRLSDIRTFCLEQQTRFKTGRSYPVGLEKNLFKRKEALVASLRSNEKQLML